MGFSLGSVGDFYKKGFSLYKTDYGKAGLVAGCSLAGGGPACQIAGAELFDKKAAKVKAKQASVMDTAAPATLSPSVTVGLLIGGVVLVALVGLGAAR